MNKKLTVIIPVYNGERFIAACLNSLVAQINDEVEIIVVNDGSTDSTDHIITTQYQSLIDSGHLIYRPTPNGGVSAARNLGLEIASGDYLAFVDADDLVAPNYVTTLLRAMDDSPSIIELGYRTIDLNGAVLKERSFIHTKFGRHAQGAVLDRVFAACLWYPFLRVINRKLFEGMRFPVGVRFCEDLITFSAIYKKAGVIRCLPDVLYDYRINPAGATLNIKPDYAPHLVTYYRKILHDQSFANKALKIGLAYVIRSCIAATTDKLGRLESDIEADIRSLMLTPKIFFYVRSRLVVHAFWGVRIRGVKIFVKSLI